MELGVRESTVRLAGEVEVYVARVKAKATPGKERRPETKGYVQ